MRDTCTSPFEPEKFDLPAAGAREGQFMAQKWPEMIKEVLADTELSKINAATAIEM